MKHSFCQLALSITFLLPAALLGQDLQLNWFETKELDYRSYSDGFIQPDGGELYRVYQISGGMGLLAPLKYRISRLDETLREIESVKVDQDDVGPFSTLLDLRFSQEAILAIAFHYDEAAKTLVFFSALFDPITLNQTRPFEPFKTVSDISWNSHQPTDYPITNTTSPNGKYIAVQFYSQQPNLNPGLPGLKKKDNEESFLSTIFVLNEELETIFDSEMEGGIGIGSISDDKTLHFLKRDDWRNSYNTLNIETDEFSQVEIDSSRIFSFLEDDQDNSYVYTVYQSEEEEIVFELFSPTYMEAPLVATIPIDKSNLFSKKFNRNSSIMMLLSLQVLDVHRTEDGNYIITTERIASGTTTDLQTNLISSTYSYGNIVSFCVDANGSVLWMTCIPKDSEESTTEMGSVVSFRTSNGLHLLYNEGIKNLNLGELDKPKNYRVNSAGRTIIAHARISDDGQLFREELYDLSEDKMLLSVRDCKKVSDELIILNLRKRRKEKMGIIRLD